MTTTSMVKPKFLSKPAELGIVAVDFSGGQVRPSLCSRGSSCCDSTLLSIHLLTSIKGKAGVDVGPETLIKAGLLDSLRDDLYYDLHYDGSVHSFKSLIPEVDPDHRRMKNPRAVSNVTQRLCQQVYEQSVSGRMVLTLGGDHSIAIGSVAGVAKATRERLGRDIALIWVDAHADINTPETSDSGNVHGMPVAFLTRLARENKVEGEELPFAWIEDDMTVSLAKLVYIGLRDVDRGEKQILRENGIKAFSMHDIDRFVPFPSFFFTITNNPQPRNRESDGHGTRPHRLRHTHPPLLRHRRLGPNLRTNNRHSSAWWTHPERGRFHRRVCA